MLKGIVHTLHAKYPGLCWKSRVDFHHVVLLEPPGVASEHRLEVNSNHHWECPLSLKYSRRFFNNLSSAYF